MVRKKVCPSCGTTLTQEKYQLYCDNCKTMIDQEKFYPLKITVFHNTTIDDPEHVEDFEFCSWKCVREWLIKNLTKIKKLDFINLPYICQTKRGFSKTQYVDFLDGFLRDFVGV